jgi:hypothetical protein
MLCGGILVLCGAILCVAVMCRSVLGEAVLRSAVLCDAVPVLRDVFADVCDAFLLLHDAIPAPCDALVLFGMLKSGMFYVCILYCTLNMASRERGTDKYPSSAAVYP